MVIRGRFIQQATILKRERKILFAKLESTFNDCYQTFQSSPNANSTKLERARLDLDLFLTDLANKLIRKRQHIQYLKANKPDTLMARILKNSQHNQTPIKLKISREAYTSNPVKILEIFRSNLAKLYSSSPNFDKSKADVLFSNITLPNLDQLQRDQLENTITDNEVLNAIKSLKLRKRPGPDGFSAAYYRQYAHSLTPVLTKAFNSILEGHSFRTETLTSIITMIPKPHSDSTSLTNYRPISLLNLDIKLLAKIMATRLNSIIGHLIHKDQTGFMPKRQTDPSLPCVSRYKESI